MATLDIKFSKFDNRPWGFRLAGGSDFPEPLTVIRVSEGSLAECMGLKVGDVVVKLNDQPISDMTHGQAHEALTLAGNNFVLGVRRTEDPSKAIEGIEDKIEPYMLPIEEILFAAADERREATPDEVPQIEEESAPVGDKPQAEEYPEKPRDINSDPLPKTDLTEEEIAQLIVHEEEVLNDKGVLGVNFRKIRPRAPLLKQSEVFRELQHEIAAEPEEVQERARQSTFLKKPERPAPKPRAAQEDSEPEVEPYRVVIKKQPKRPITERLLQRGLLDPSRARTPDTATSVASADATPEKTTPAATPEPTNQSSDGGSRPQSVASVIEIVDHSNNPEGAKGKSGGDQVPQPEPRIEEPADEEEEEEEEEEDKPVQVVIRRPSKAEVDVEVEVTMDRDKIKELVTTEISLERQLASVQSQLMALKQLPSEIEKHLKIVSEQLHKIMELSGIDESQADENSQAEEPSRQEEAQVCSRRDEPEQQQRREEEQREVAEEDTAVSDLEETSSSYPPHLADTEYSSSYYANLAEDNTEDDATWRSDKVEISVKSNEDDGQHRVKKYIVTYESKVVEETKRTQRPTSRDPSPIDVESIESFEADPNLTLQQQLVEEFKHRKGRKRDSRDHLWQPQAKQLELTYGRRWRCPNDFFNDEMIADVLSSQAEVIRGRALGVNFKKFEKANALPNYDHLMNSSVYKMIHKMDAEPKKGIPARPPKVLAAEDIIERVNTPVCGISNNECVRS